MKISLVNMTKTRDAEVQHVVRAINMQCFEFFDHWGIMSRVRLEGRRGVKPNFEKLAELRGDAIIYLLSKADDSGALGWHDANLAGVPYGVVFLDIAEQLDEPWTVTLSHEVLELVLDPHVNRLAAGPHPTDPRRTVFHWMEACDAVQAESYHIEGVAVSDFLLPLYFTPQAEPGSRHSHLGVDVESFGVAAGGYIGFYDPELHGHDTHFADAVAGKRAKTKAQAGLARRAQRYRKIAA